MKEHSDTNLRLDRSELESVLIELKLYVAFIPQIWSIKLGTAIGKIS